MGLLVENGPRFVASCATLPSYVRPGFRASALGFRVLGTDLLSQEQ